MKRTYLVLIIAMLVIGFAAVTTNLVINGTINFGFNSNDFDSNVVFTYAKAKNGEANITSEDKKTITFETIKLENVNQEAILKYDIANKSLQYDASVTITCGLEEASKSYEQYLKIYNSIEGKFELKSGETKTGYLTVTLIKAYNESLNKDVNMLCTIEATPGGRETEGTYTPVEHQEYEELILKGADPVLEGTQVQTMAVDTSTPKKLIPVKISDGGEVTRADTTKEWYNYENKKWANAVILNDNVEEPEAGQPIDDDLIESYFVWIPKYRYKLWSVDTNSSTHTGPFEIEIEFGLEDTTDDNSGECTTPLNKDRTQALSGNNGQCNNDEWMTHPSFITMGVNGFWVGKFEVGYKEAATTEDAKSDEVNSAKVIVKPNVYSWRNVTTENIFTSLKNYATNLDSHMIKNTEWGAIALLSHSKYGIINEVVQNKNLEYKTGYANGTFEYKSEEGIKASTTGNITGIYDMSGGSWEKVASYRNIATDTSSLGNSGFTKEEIKLIGEKYFDVYDENTLEESYENRILGDATGEMIPFNNKKSSWYDDYSVLFDSYFWLARGGDCQDGTGAGQFSFYKNSGGTFADTTSRLVLSPN